jgi:hypothetical protein
MSDLSPHGDHAQLSLFERKTDSGKSKELNLTLDRIHAKFDEDALVPGTLLKE